MYISIDYLKYRQQIFSFWTSLEFTLGITYLNMKSPNIQPTMGSSVGGWGGGVSLIRFPTRPISCRELITVMLTAFISLQLLSTF